MKEAPALSQVTTSSLDALRSFAAGLRANDVEGDYPKAVTLFEDAIAKDSGFAAAYVQLSYSARSAGVQRLNRDTLMAKAYRLRDRLPERERYSIEGAYWSRKDRPKAIAAYERAVAIDSTDLEVLNSLALLYSGSRDYGRAERLFRRGVPLEPENGVVLTNFAGTLIAAGKLDAADSLLRDMRARKIPYPTERRAADLLYLRGRYDSLETLARGATRGSNATFAAGAANYLRDLVAVRGRFRESDSMAADLVARGAGGERAGARDGVLTQAMTDGWFRGRTQQAIARLDSLARAIPAREPSTLSLRLQLVSMYAILGAADRARTALREAESIVLDSATRRNTQSGFIVAQGDIAMAEGRADAAAAAYRRAETAGDGLPEGCVFCAPAYLGVAYDRANMRRFGDREPRAVPQRDVARANRTRSVAPRAGAQAVGRAVRGEGRQRARGDALHRVRAPLGARRSGHAAEGGRGAGAVGAAFEDAAAVRRLLVCWLTGLLVNQPANQSTSKPAT